MCDSKLPHVMLTDRNASAYKNYIRSKDFLFSEALSNWPTSHFVFIGNYAVCDHFLNGEKDVRRKVLRFNEFFQCFKLHQFGFHLGYPAMYPNGIFFMGFELQFSFDERDNLERFHAESFAEIQNVRHWFMHLGMQRNVMDDLVPSVEKAMKEMLKNWYVGEKQKSGELPLTMT